MESFHPVTSFTVLLLKWISFCCRDRYRHRLASVEQNCFYHTFGVKNHTRCHVPVLKAHLSQMCTFFHTDRDVGSQRHLVKGVRARARASCTLSHTSERGLDSEDAALHLPSRCNLDAEAACSSALQQQDHTEERCEITSPHPRVPGANPAEPLKNSGAELKGLWLRLS